MAYENQEYRYNSETNEWQARKALETYPVQYGDFVSANEEDVIDAVGQQAVDNAKAQADGNAYAFIRVDANGPVVGSTDDMVVQNTQNSAPSHTEPTPDAHSAYNDPDFVSLRNKIAKDLSSGELGSSLMAPSRSYELANSEELTETDAYRVGADGQWYKWQADEFGNSHFMPVDKSDVDLPEGTLQQAEEIAALRDEPIIVQTHTPEAPENGTILHIIQTYEFTTDTGKELGTRFNGEYIPKSNDEMMSDCFPDNLPDLAGVCTEHFWNKSMGDGDFEQIELAQPLSLTVVTGETLDKNSTAEFENTVQFTDLNTF